MSRQLFEGNGNMHDPSSSLICPSTRQTTASDGELHKASMDLGGNKSVYTVLDRAPPQADREGGLRTESVICRSHWISLFKERDQVVLLHWTDRRLFHLRRVFTCAPLRT